MRHPQDQPNCSWGLAPLPLRQPQPYIAICSLKACCASQGLDTLYPLAWASDGKPQRSWQASGPFRGPHSVTHGLWAPSLPPMEAGRWAAERGGLEAGFGHRPGGPLPGGGFLFIPYSFLVALVFLEVQYNGSLLLHVVFPLGAVSYPPPPPHRRFSLR